MNCTEAEKSLYLFREGELSAEERFSLNIHLENCASCWKTAVQLDAMRQLVQRQYLSMPMPDELDNEKRKILALTLDQNQSDSILPGVNLLLRITYNKVVRLTSAAMVAALVLVFLLQNYMAFNSILTLEKKYGNPGRYMNSVSASMENLSADDLRFLEAAQIYFKKTVSPGSMKTVSHNLFLLSFRKHREIREIALRATDFDPFWIHLLNQDIAAKTINDHQNTRRE